MQGLLLWAVLHIHLLPLWLSAPDSLFASLQIAVQRARMPISLVKLLLLPKPLLTLVCLTVSHWVSEANALTGDSWCGTLMCVTATVDNTTAIYELRSLNQLGWMSIGFGSHMADSPMVIMWPNADGSVSLSQRQATGHVEPVVELSPPRLASLSTRTRLSPDTDIILAFNVSKNNDTVQQLIWAYGVTRPLPNPSSDLEQHLDAGPFTLNLTKPISLSPSSSIRTLSPSSTSSTGPSTSISSAASHSTIVNRQHRLLTAHAVLSFCGFLVLLPLASLIARWGRTTTSRWYPAHWFINVVLGIPTIVVGWILGPLLVASQRQAHVASEHQVCGVILFALYSIQVILGTSIHFRRPKSGSLHPPLNIIHVVLGLLIIGFALFQTQTGISRAKVLSKETAKIVSAIWIAWAVAITTGYFLGLTRLRKQLDQERLGWHHPWSLPLMTRNSESRRRSVSSATGHLDQRRAVGRRVDDGTHDIFSEATARENLEASQESVVTEMRELRTLLPIATQS